jgi:hypothetical protein
VSEDTSIQRDPPDYLPEVDSYGTESLHYTSEPF